MVMSQQQFKEISPKKLRTLVEISLGLITDAAPYPEIKSLVTSIVDAANKESNINKLQLTVISSLELVRYWEQHQDSNNRLVKAEARIIYDMLAKTGQELGLGRSVARKPQ